MSEEGKVIGHYRMTDVLGTGGMGTVFRALDLRLGRHVAMKTVRHDIADRPETVKRLAEEARLAAAIRHPYVVMVHEFMETDTESYVVMEWVDGQTLSTYLRRKGTLDIDRIAHLFGGILDGLAAIHEEGLVHRDLKASNIMITRHGHIKIMDLGLAADIRPSEGSALAGSLAYLAPEVIEGSAFTTRSDLYAVGVLMYEALVGLRPFAAESTGVLANQILSGRFRPIRDLQPSTPTALSELVESLLSRGREERPESAREALESLRRLAPRSSSMTWNEDFEVIEEATVGPREEAAADGTGSITSIDPTGAATLATVPAANLKTMVRAIYYRLRPPAAYRRFARLVDKSFLGELSDDEKHELTWLETFLDDREERHWRDAKEGLMRVRDKLRASEGD